MSHSKIEWTESTWNPITGCTKISAGCQHCYAERMAKRLKAMGQPKYAKGFKVTLHPQCLEEPLRWHKPRMIFVNSMGDSFHRDVPDSFIRGMLGVMRRAHWHTFQLLTKRADRLAEFSQQITWPSNCWIGVTVENTESLDRIDHLRSVSCAVRFLSLEPLLGPLPNLNLTDIDWVIVGGESGPGARPMDPEWVRDLRDQCLALGVPFFFKQWGGFHKARNGRELDCRTWSQYPTPRRAVVDLESAAS